jgi:hypothetical protein
MIRLISKYFTCPTSNRPLFAIVPDGIEIKCHICRHQVRHFIGRSHLEQAWDDLSKLDTKPLQAVTA